MAELKRKLKKSSDLGTDIQSLLALEKHLGECTGHGYCLLDGEEDIGWYTDRKKGYRHLGITVGRKVLSVKWQEVHEDSDEPKDLDWSTMPKRLRNGLVQALKAHVTGRLPAQLAP